MAVQIVGGDPRNGKGVLACWLIDQYCRQRRLVYTNIELLPKCPWYDRVVRIDDPNDRDAEGRIRWPLYRGTPSLKGRPASKDYMAFWHYVMPGSVVIVDEADVEFDCTDHEAMGQDLRIWLKWQGKLGIDIVFIVQAVENLYIRVRRLAERTILCEWNWRKMRSLQNLAKYIGQDRAMRLSRFNRSEFRGCKQFSAATHISDGYISYAEAKRFFGWYRTTQIFGDMSNYIWANPERFKQDDLPGRDSSAVGGDIGKLAVVPG